MLIVTPCNPLYVILANHNKPKCLNCKYQCLLLCLQSKHPIPTEFENLFKNWKKADFSVLREAGLPLKWSLPNDNQNF